MKLRFVHLVFALADQICSCITRSYKTLHTGRARVSLEGSPAGHHCPEKPSVHSLSPSLSSAPSLTPRGAPPSTAAVMDYTV